MATIFNMNLSCDFFTWQLPFIEKLHTIRNPLFDLFFKFLNFFDTQEFVFILIPAIWVGYSWRAGVRLFYLLALSSVVNSALKMFFAFPRPFHLEPSLAVIKVTGFGFPSGGAQQAVLLSALLVYTFRSRWAWIVGLNYFFWISLSRLYLGVHFPIDILGGWALGLIFLCLYIYVRPGLERRLNKWNDILLLLLSQTLPLFLLCSGKFREISLGAMGVGFGLFLCSRYHLFLALPKKKMEMFQRAFLAVFGIFFLYRVLGLLPSSYLYHLLMHFLLGLWLSWGATRIWLNFKRRRC